VTDASGNAASGAGLRVLPLAIWQQLEANGFSWTNGVDTLGAWGLTRALAQNAKTDPDGVFWLRYLAPGYYVVGAQVDDAWGISEPVEVLAGHETGPVVLEVLEER
jgi:hypothetical protein